MRKFQCLLFVSKRSYICYYVIRIIVPLEIESSNIRLKIFAFYIAVVLVYFEMKSITASHEFVNDWKQ